MELILNELVGAAIGAVLVGFIVYAMFFRDDRKQATPKKRWPAWKTRAGLLERALDAHRADMLSGDHHLPRYKQLRTFYALVFFAVIVLLLIIAAFTDFWSAQDIPRPSQPTHWQ